MIDRRTSRKSTSRTAPVAWRSSCNRSNPPDGAAAPGAVRRRAIIAAPRNTRSHAAQGWAGARAAALAALALTLPAGAAGCQGDGGAVSVRWRIAERTTGRLLDPRDVADGRGGCCERGIDGSACIDGGWRITRVRVVLADPSSAVEIADAPTGLDAGCSARELTTPFTVPEGLFAITL